jgi:hypothetical protein
MFCSIPNCDNKTDLDGFCICSECLSKAVNE